MSKENIEKLKNELKELKKENKKLKYIIKDCLDVYDHEGWSIDMNLDLEKEIRKMPEEIRE